MRWLIPFVLLAAVELPALAAKRETVGQLEEVLGAAIVEHKTDAEIARQIKNVEFSEQLTELRLDRLAAQLALGPESRLSLQLLADRSAFLDPPWSEMLSAAAPDDVAQQNMLRAARSYVAQTLPRLPNFLATRIVNRYDDSPQALKQGGWPVRAGLHEVGTSSREISVRSEQDKQSVSKGFASSQEQSELTSWGEFGFLLTTIINDTQSGKVTWSHWERTAEGRTAVFHYSVASSASHYEVIGTVNHGPKTSFTAQHPNTSIIRTTPGYFGSLWLDPATGTILHTTIETDPGGSGQFRRAAVMVQYGPVQIGDRMFICPLRSVALYDAIVDATNSLGNAPTEWLNETIFTGYHRFASTTRILTDSVTPE
jgi:hypothetical protein